MNKRTFTVAASVAAALCFVAASAHAANFPVSGAITVNGNAGDLPSGGAFGNSTYDATTGALSAGKFTFPQSSTTIDGGALGNVTVTYQLTQTNTSTALVASDGTAAMTAVSMRLSVVSTSLPLPVTPCAFEPIALDLTGTGSAAGLDLEDRSFTVPPTANSCGGLASTINAQIAGNNNSIQLHLAGDFTPPSGDDDDKIFVDGFDG